MAFFISCGIVEREGFLGCKQRVFLCVWDGVDGEEEEEERENGETSSPHSFSTRSSLVGRQIDDNEGE